MKINIKISNIQHIKSLDFEIDLSLNRIHCIVGKNGSGKTTLVRSIQNIKSADTFKKTASPYIFTDTSKISYKFDEEIHDYTFNRKFQQIDSKSIISNAIKKNIVVELPIPHGVRFNHERKLSNIDDEIRSKISIEDYVTPYDLVGFLKQIYNTDRFDNIKEITIRNEKFYIILKEDKFYIREDYFSSGEYFVIHLYKLIIKKCKLIVIDELDISLDSSAQVRLIKELRQYCNEFSVNLLFTTHSLALIKTLEESELFYMENNDGIAEIKNVSYNHIKSVLFGFTGWDRYILTEDDMLQSYIDYAIKKSNTPLFYTYKVIYIAGSSNVVDLLERNKSEHFFSTSNNVLAVLDADVSDQRYCRGRNDLVFIPFQSVEKKVRECYENNEFEFVVDIDKEPEKNYAKKLYKAIIRNKYMTQVKIFEHINNRSPDGFSNFQSSITDFLSKE